MVQTNRFSLTLTIYRCALFTGIFFIFFFKSWCNPVDSLLNLAKEEQDPELLILVYDELAWEFRYRNPILSKLYAQKELRLALDMQDLKAEANACNRLGLHFAITGQFDSSLYYYRQAEQIELNEQHWYGIARSANQIGNLHRDNQYNEIAISYYKKAKIIFGSEGKVIQEAVALQNIGFCKREMGQYDTALIVLQESLDLLNQVKDTANAIVSIREQGHVYLLSYQFERAASKFRQAHRLLQLIPDEVEALRVTKLFGDLYLEQAMYDSALYYYEQTLTGYRSDRLGKQAILNNLAKTYYRKGDWDSALVYYRKTFDLSTKLDQQTSAGLAINGIGIIQRKRGQYDSAIYNYNRSIELFEKENSIHLLHPLMNLSILYEDIGNYEKALELRTQYEQLFKEGERNKQEAIRLQLRLSENELLVTQLRATKDQAALKSKNLLTTLILLGILFFLLIILVWSYYRTRLLQARSKVQMQQAKIKGEQDTQARIAQDLHDELGNMLKMVKFHFKAAHKVLVDKQEQQQEHFDQALDLLSKALDYARNLAKDLLPATLKSFGLLPALKEIQNSLDGLNGLRVVLNPVNMQDRLPEWVERNLYYIIRELAGNVINHAQANLLTIQVIRHKDQISITVEDDGIGFEPEAAANQEGMGMKNLADRVKAIDGTFTIDSRISTNAQPKSGTVVLIDIPLNHLDTKPNDSHA